MVKELFRKAVFDSHGLNFAHKFAVASHSHLLDLLSVEFVVMPVQWAKFRGARRAHTHSASGQFYA